MGVIRNALERIAIYNINPLGQFLRPVEHKFFYDRLEQGLKDDATAHLLFQDFISDTG